MSQKGLPVRQAGLAPILIVLLIAAIAGIGGYFVYQNQTKPSFPPQSAPQPTPVPQYTISTNQQTNLKTYTNKKAEFLIQYSMDYRDSAGNNFLTIDDQKIFKMNDGCADRPNFRIELSVEQTRETSAKDIAKKRKDDDKTWAGEIIKQSEIIIDGTQASTTEWRLGKCQDGVSIDIVHNGYRIEINKFPLEGQKDKLNQILSTFKFLP